MTQSHASSDEGWCAAQRANVAAYLQREGIAHGQIGESPAWDIAPYVSIWAIESLNRPSWIGWWVISGDLPTDYISAERVKHPRAAMREFAERWSLVAAKMKRGEEPNDVQVGTPEKSVELAPLLEARAWILAHWANDDSIWVGLGP